MPIKIVLIAKTPMNKKSNFTFINSNKKPVSDVDKAVVPKTAILTIENNLPLNSFGTTF